MNNETTLRIKFAILQVAYWCAYASFTSFATSLLLYGGTPVTIIGTAVAFQTGGAFLGQMVLSVLCDRRKTNKWIFVIASAVTMLAYGLVYTFRTTSWVILCSAAVYVGAGYLDSEALSESEPSVWTHPVDWLLCLCPLYWRVWRNSEQPGVWNHACGGGHLFSAGGDSGLYHT